MRDRRSFNDAVESEIEDIARAEAVANRGESCDAARPQALDSFVKRWARLLLRVIGEPGLKVKLLDS